MSHNRAYALPRSRSFDASPFSNRTFSIKTATPGCTSRCRRQSEIKSTWMPSIALSSFATGRRLNLASKVSSSGRPRCDMMMTAAFSRIQCSIVGIAARIRALLVTDPSLIGTLRSSRIRTRLPAREKSPRRLYLTSQSSHVQPQQPPRR